MKALLEYDVVVVGAGVAGLTTSWVIAKKGFRVLIIDSKPREKIGERACGDAIGKHHFRELGWFPPDNTINHYYRGAIVVSPSEEYTVEVPGEGISIDSLKFGQWLLNNAIKHGAELLDQHVVVNVKANDNGVEKLLVKDIRTGEIKEVKAKFYVDAGGSKPAFRLKLPSNWPISEKPFITDFNLAFREVIVPENPIQDEFRDYVVIFMNPDIAPGGYWWLFPKENGRVVNVGLGVVWSVNRYNPRERYERYIKPRFPGKVLHSGGGLVPTRRPLPTLVWKNVGVVGDAAYTVNPVHGGGRGSSMLAGTILGSHVGNALEAGVINDEVLWDVNKEYMAAYGAKQASLDILRMYLQKLSRNDLEFVFKKGIVDGRIVLEIGEKGNLVEDVITTLKTLIVLLGKPSLLNKLRTIKKYMNEVRKLYSEEYPEKPQELNRWIKKVEKVFNEYRDYIGYDPGPRVPW